MNIVAMISWVFFVASGITAGIALFSKVSDKTNTILTHIAFLLICASAILSLVCIMNY